MLDVLGCVDLLFYFFYFIFISLLAYFYIIFLFQKKRKPKKVEGLTVKAESLVASVAVGQIYWVLLTSSR